jgi:hypothetical protein
MAIPHYAYFILKMAVPYGVISVKGDVKCAYNYNRESRETTDRLTTSVELQELKKNMAKSHLDPIMPEAKSSKTSIQLEDSFGKTIPLSPDEPSKVAHVGNSFDPK